MRKLVFIGDRFYYKSGTSMSSLYEKKDGHYERFDWGFVNVALGRGESVLIEPASADEIAMFERELAKMPRRGV